MYYEVVSRGGRTVAGFGLGDYSGWPGDLLAYRKEWEPFIAAHLALWRYLNALFEGTPAAAQCPSGIFTAADIANLDPTMRAFCASLALTRTRISDTDPGGILTQWNAWANRSSAEVLAGAATMLKWHQDVVARVGGLYKDELLKIATIWNVQIQLPEVPAFSTQQQIISQLEGAYIATKGVLQIAGYATGHTLAWAGSQLQALTEGLTETVKAIPKAVSNPWTWIGITAAIAVVGAGLFFVYRPPTRRLAERN